MEKTDNMPIWVFLAFASIPTRKAALLLISISVLFALYCIPWVTIATDAKWVESIFKIKDWSWFAMMIPIVIWYLLSLRWSDKHHAWPSAKEPL